MLTRLKVEHYRCFDEIELKLRAADNPGGGWNILVGENGTGKSSLLQAIVFALMDPRPLTALNNSPWVMVRQGSPEGTTASLSVNVGPDHEFRKTVSNRRGSYVEQATTSSVELPLLLAFSARRRIANPGELPESENFEVERVRGLFDPNLPLLAHDAFAQFTSKNERRNFARVVRDVITHELESSGEHMFPLVDAVELRGNGGVTTNAQLLEQERFGLRYGNNYQAKVAVQDLSDGYQAMLTIVLEILTQAALHSGVVPKPGELNAIILIDEIEAHLHPRWQRSVVPLLREVFPECQFIVTTHSPLVVGSAEPGEVQVLTVAADGDVKVDLLDERLQALDADEIYDAVFGVPRASNDEYIERERLFAQSKAMGVDPDPEIAALLQAAWDGRKRLIDND
ncbi:AAA family ATPase [Curtobacterium sp. MCBA15_001]|uniref:AAA family ATPase n=1 Tax=Curtobacterium sp. MCBA15_001 TaxID=1898731 RepID=UPI0009F6CE23|nr:ATP-binding protein [Curtobacterium sp. MCBA15_001]